MNIATVLRYVDNNTGGPWDFRYYIMHDFYLLAEKYGFGLVTVANVNDMERICANCDGLIIPGSATDINPKYYGGEDMPGAVDEYALDAALIRYFHEHQKPIFGICGGHQALNVYFGGTLKRVDDPSGHVEAPEKPCHRIQIEPGTFTAEAFGTETAVVNSYHNWEIGKLAPNLKVAARTFDGVIEAVESCKDKVFATQWHPERSFHDANENPLDSRILENFVKLCAEYCGR